MTIQASASFIVILIGVVLLALSAIPSVTFPSKERPWSLFNLGWAFVVCGALLMRG